MGLYWGRGYIHGGLTFEMLIGLHIWVRIFDGAGGGGLIYEGEY